MVASTLAFDKPAFKNVAMHGFITDVEGEKMSKSLGNIISPYEVISKYGADTLRYYAIDITIGDDMSFSWDEINLKYKNLMILWNLHNFLIEFKQNNGSRLVTNPVLGDEERYMLSRLYSTIKKLTSELDLYHLDATPHLVEALYMDLSRTYIQLIREKSVVGSDEDKDAILYTIYHTLLGVLKMFSIVCPFITEKIYMDFKEEFGLDRESIHDFDWPAYDDKVIDIKLEASMDHIQDVIQSVLSCRDKLNLGVRWPLSECVIDTNDADVSYAVEFLNGLVMKQVNVKKVTLRTMDVELKVKPNFKTLGKDFGNNTHKVVELISEHALMISEHVRANKVYSIEGFDITSNHVIIEKICPNDYVMADIKGGSVYLNKVMDAALELEGYAREITRRVQQLRKDSNLNKKDVIELFIDTELAVDEYSDMIAEKCGASKVLFGHNDFKFDASIIEKIKGKEVKIGFNRV